MFGRALSWGSAFAVCIVHCSLVYQFEHSGKVRRAWFKFGFENFYSSLLSGSASFLCAALMSPQRTKQYCPQIEYIYIFIFIQGHPLLTSTSSACSVLTLDEVVVWRFVLEAGFHLGPIYRGAEGKSEWSNGGGCKKISSFFLRNSLYIVICT